MVGRVTSQTRRERERERESCQKKDKNFTQKFTESANAKVVVTAKR